MRGEFGTAGTPGGVRDGAFERRRERAGPDQIFRGDDGEEARRFDRAFWNLPTILTKQATMNDTVGDGGSGGIVEELAPILERQIRGHNS